MSQVYSMRKIPVVQQNEVEVDESLDKVKILELSNIIDEWEKELLFSHHGFFSLKGKEVENKTKEFSRELEKYINNKINSIKFSDNSSKEIALEIKKNKLLAIEKQMQLYEVEELEKWKIKVYENSIKSCINRAVLYKNDKEIVEKSYQNAISVLENISKSEKWNDKTYNAQKEKFEANFYFELINAFVLDKDVKSYLYFDKFKKKLNQKDSIKLEKSVEFLKETVVAYNYSKELFSYDLDDKEIEKEINEVKDLKQKELIKKYFNLFKKEKKKQEQQEKLDQNEKNWKEIISCLDEDSTKAEMFVDYTLNEESISSKKSYIKTIRKNGEIKTDKHKFLEILTSFFTDSFKFKQDGISNYRKDLSSEDYKILEKVYNLTNEKLSEITLDYNYFKEQLIKNKITTDDKIYDCFKLVLYEKEHYISSKKEELDIEKKMKIIDSILSRYVVKEERK